MLFRKYLKCSGKSCERVASDKCRIIDVLPYHIPYTRSYNITIHNNSGIFYFFSSQKQRLQQFSRQDNSLVSRSRGSRWKFFLVRPYTTQSHLTELLKMHTLKTSLTKILMRKFRRFVFIEVFSMLLMN